MFPKVCIPQRLAPAFKLTHYYSMPCFSAPFPLSSRILLNEKKGCIQRITAWRILLIAYLSWRLHITFEAILQAHLLNCQCSQVRSLHLLMFRHLPRVIRLSNNASHHSGRTSLFQRTPQIVIALSHPSARSFFHRVY